MTLQERKDTTDIIAKEADIVSKKLFVVWSDGMDGRVSLVNDANAASLRSSQ